MSTWVAKPRRAGKAERGPGIYPQPGFQEAALGTAADIAIIGGSAGGGKTYALLMEASRHRFNPAFGAVIFRRTYPMIMSEGGLWDTSKALYAPLGATMRENQMDWKFPGGAQVSFRHLQYERNVLDWQGSQIPLIIFDELTHFTKYQFWYMLTRNRSLCGVRPYVRASCNPEPDHWVAEFVAWWINQETGFPIPERSGVLRYLTRDGETYVWGDTPEAVIAKAPHLFAGPLAGTRPLSVTFIPGTIYENQKLLAVNPEYLGNLMAQDEATRAQLLDGNWKVKVDGLALYDYARLRDLLTNYVTPARVPRRYITGDPAGFGRDKCVLMVWQDFEVVQLVVISRSDNREIYEAIEAQRKRWQVAQSDVLVDQDGLGGGLFKWAPGYQGFSGGAQPLADPLTQVKENYKNLKTQCYYRSADRVNRGEIRVTITDDNVLLDGQRTTKFKRGGRVVDVRDVLQGDLRAVKRAKTDEEGKKQINTKEEQKIILNGYSPDFGDCFSLREWFELRPVVQKATMRRMN